MAGLPLLCNATATSVVLIRPNNVLLCPVHAKFTQSKLVTAENLEVAMGIWNENQVALKVLMTELEITPCSEVRYL